MRISLCSSILVKNATEGATKNIHYIARGLQERGIEVDIIAPATRPQELSHGFSSLVKGLKFARYYKDALRKAEIIHYHALNPSLILPLKMAKCQRKPIICHLWDSYFGFEDLRGILPSYGSSRDLFKEYVPHMLFNNVATATISLVGIRTIIVSNTFMKKRIEALELNCRVYCIPNGVNPSNYEVTFGNAKKEAKKDFGLSPDEKIVTYYGHINRLRGVDCLVEAMSKVIKSNPDARLVIAESGRKKFDIRQIVKATRIWDKTTFLGFVDVKKLLKATDVGVLPLRSHLGAAVYPNTLFEMMAAGLPVVITNVGGIPEAIQNGQNGLLVEPGNPNLMANAINRLLQDENLRVKLGLEARTTVEEKFDWANIINQLIAVYEHI